MSTSVPAFTRDMHELPESDPHDVTDMMEDFFAPPSSDPDDIPDLEEDFEALEEESRAAWVEHEARPSACVLVPIEYVLDLLPRSDDGQHILIYF